ncbi:hypothetical protein [Staphylococcus agnetis]|uniref:hypothetical protein n=1 Tax=Staphylococcus agnetis TaxID=985762 RepID=UPI00208DED5F|nr:hypothetical protein [Staphylococcus agnetis]MCO4353528.1 hypothetical protein [Staphylococcus agnetis]
MIKILIFLLVITTILVSFNKFKEKKMKEHIEKVRLDSQKRVRIDNINHITKNKRNNVVIVYPFGKIELEPGQMVFVDQVNSEGILLPKAEVKFKYKKIAGFPMVPQGITDKEIRAFYLNNLKVYILKERFNKLMI